MVLPILWLPSTVEVSTPQSRHAWEIWKKLTDFSEYLRDAYEHDFPTLAASEPPPKGYHQDNLPF
jgi:hypothetical protein